MLELIKDELKASGVDSSQFISINFEDMRYTYLQTAQALHDEITKLASSIDGKVYLFFDEIQEVTDWEKCIIMVREQNRIMSWQNSDLNYLKMIIQDTCSEK